MLQNLSDEQLVERAVSNDADAFAEIIRRWDRKIFALCFGMMGREEDARDAAQETFVSAYKNLGNFRGEAKVSSWLHRIAVNQCLTIKRRKKARPEELFDDRGSAEDNRFIESPRRSPSLTTEQTERLRIVRQAVSSLPTDLRQVIVMKEFEEMTFQEISDTLELPLSTVKSRLYTGLKQLRMKLERFPIEIV